MKTYKVDLDYESFLFNPSYNENAATNHKLIREFEYVFFLIEKEKFSLKNIKSYESQYLKFLSSLGFTIPEFKPHSNDYEYWWGNHHDKALEQKLNSKLTSSVIAQKNNWGFFEGAIVQTIEEVKFHLDKYSNKKKWILKRPNSFSGIGHYQFNSDSIDEAVLNKILSEELLLEPFYERVFDIGTTFVLRNGVIKNEFMVENFNLGTGGFKGGVGAHDADKFKKYIGAKYKYSLDQLQKITKEIADYYISLGAMKNIQIDSFVYLEEQKLKLYPLVEVNYRKTMGLVIQSLADKFEEFDLIEWKILKVKDALSNPLGNEWVKISPEGNYFHSYFKKIML